MVRIMGRFVELPDKLVRPSKGLDKLSLDLMICRDKSGSCIYCNTASFDCRIATILQRFLDQLLHSQG